MSFFRTPNGIANQALFVQARYVVYLEESPSTDVGRAVDSAFWREFFSASFNGAFHFKPLGGKHHVEEMARAIIGGSVPNSFCAMDIDYDRLFGHHIEDDRVFYTYGYGVECDLLSEVTLPRLLRFLIPGAELASEIGEQIWRDVLATVRDDRWCLISDQLAAARGRSTIDRRRPQGCLNVEVLPVRFRRDRIRAQMRECRGLPVQFALALDVTCRPEAVPAHTFFELVYHTIVRSISTVTEMVFSKDWIRSAAVAIFSVQFLDNFAGDARVHYSALAGRNISRFSSVGG